MINSFREIKVLQVFTGVDHIWLSLSGEKSLRMSENKIGLEGSIRFQNGKNETKGGN